MIDAKKLAHINETIQETFGMGLGDMFRRDFEMIERLEAIPMRIAYDRIEASKFIGEDGKEYFRL